MVSEWGLVCGHAGGLRVLGTFTHLGGLVCAPFVGTAADRLGRQPLILACAVAALAGAALTVYAPHFFHFVVSRMLVAAALAGCSLSSLVLLFEVTSEASRCTASFSLRPLAKELQALGAGSLGKCQGRSAIGTRRPFHATPSLQRTAPPAVNRLSVECRRRSAQRCSAGLSGALRRCALQNVDNLKDFFRSVNIEHLS